MLAIYFLDQFARIPGFSYTNYNKTIEKILRQTIFLDKTRYEQLPKKLGRYMVAYERLVLHQKYRIDRQTTLIIAQFFAFKHSLKTKIGIRLLLKFDKLNEKTQYDFNFIKNNNKKK